jgi:hypothetical protein
MPSPAPITWWILRENEQALFRKTEGVDVLVVGQEGENILEVRLADSVYAPLFVLENFPLGIHTLGEQIQFRLDAMFEVGASLGINGRFNAVFQSLNPDQSSQNQGARLTIGISYSTEDLTPLFHPPLIGDAFLSEVSCALIGLPTWSPNTKPYTGPRPSRYQRKWVI